jgi:5-methylcytosine-specific restriction protein A
MAGPRREGRTPEALAYHSWYTSRPWRALRKRILLRDHYTCKRCGRLDRPSGLIADHKTPHRGDASLFWDEANIETLCKPCHDGPKQREEKTGIRTEEVGIRRGVDARGRPTCPNHPWNRSR